MTRKDSTRNDAKKSACQYLVEDRDVDAKLKSGQEGQGTDGSHRKEYSKLWPPALAHRKVAVCF